MIICQFSQRVSTFASSHANANSFGKTNANSFGNANANTFGTNCDEGAHCDIKCNDSFLRSLKIFEKAQDFMQHQKCWENC